MFKSALIKLTLWYALIAVVLSLLFSVVIYHFAAVELREGLNNQYTAIIANDHDSDDNADLSNQEFHERAGQLYLQLIYFNVIVLVLSTGGSYFLAKRTLSPIKEAHESQVRFTAHASHELRTPLAAIRADTESVLMTKIEDPDMFKKTLQANLRDVTRMEELANHLLNVARYRSGPYVKESVDLLELSRESIREIKRSKRSIAAKINLEGERVIVNGDPIAIKQVVLSLLDNAIKYGEGKPINISLEKSGKYAVVKVIDQGLGINEKDLSHIFEPFYRADSKKRDKSGYGLGLALAKEIVEAAGGSIVAKNQADGGAVFTVRIPHA